MTDEEVGELWNVIWQNHQNKNSFLAHFKDEPCIKVIRKLVEEREAAQTEHWCGTDEQLHAYAVESFGIPKDQFDAQAQQT